MKQHRIILVGAGGSGKDYLKQKFIDRGFKPSVSLTTRKPREGEITGKDYIFTSEQTFKTMIGENKFYEYKEFRGWYYGTQKSDFEDKSLFIMTPPAIIEMDEETRKNSMVIYLDIDYETRKSRLSSRNDADSVERRLRADYVMFDKFSDYDLRITSPNF